jgi:hypothetical protein
MNDDDHLDGVISSSVVLFTTYASLMCCPDVSDLVSTKSALQIFVQKCLKNVAAAAEYLLHTTTHNVKGQRVVDMHSRENVRQQQFRLRRRQHRQDDDVSL